MPRSQRFREFTRRFVNPVLGRFVRWLPGFAIISYTGRRTGRRYRIPMAVFRRDGDYVFALTYGPDVQWVKNVLASGGCDCQQGRRTVELRDPRQFSDPTASLMPLVVRFFLRLMRVTEFLRMSPASRASGLDVFGAGQRDGAAPEGAAPMLSR